MITSDDAKAFEACIDNDGVALFPTDTVYGLGCSPYSEAAVRRMNTLKQRALNKPSAVMYFNLDDALAECVSRSVLGDLLQQLLPGPLLVLLPNPRKLFPLACGEDLDILGLRVPELGESLDKFQLVFEPVLQTSANLAGGSDPVSLDEIPLPIREAVDLVIDSPTGGKIASAVIDLSRFEENGEWKIIRHGGYDEARLLEILGRQSI